MSVRAYWEGRTAIEILVCFQAHRQTWRGYVRDRLQGAKDCDERRPAALFFQIVCVAHMKLNPKDLARRDRINCFPLLTNVFLA